MGTRFRVVLAGAVLRRGFHRVNRLAGADARGRRPHPPAQDDGLGHQHEQHRDGRQRHRRDPRHQVVHALKSARRSSACSWTKARTGCSERSRRSTRTDVFACPARWDPDAPPARRRSATICATRGTRSCPTAATASSSGPIRYISFQEQANQPRTIDYPFTFIQIQLPKGGGEGEGKLAYATKLSFDKKKNNVEMENYGTEPVRLNQIKIVKD